ncbi:MAG: T9SS type A sorting domain-containing protein [Bacteroidetes bacterium]|nr:T9SS type A sorting domain-containing protein [Bacteroidota bacterium]
MGSIINGTENGITDIPTGIKRIEHEIKMKIYPNPVANELTIESPENIEAVLLYDLLGRELRRFEATSTKLTVSLRGLVGGMYIVKIRTSSEEILRKVVVQ